MTASVVRLGMSRAALIHGGPDGSCLARLRVGDLGRGGGESVGQVTGLAFASSEVEE